MIKSVTYYYTPSKAGSRLAGMTTRSSVRGAPRRVGKLHHTRRLRIPRDCDIPKQTHQGPTSLLPVVVYIATIAVLTLHCTVPPLATKETAVTPMLQLRQGTNAEEHSVGPKGPVWPERGHHYFVFRDMFNAFDESSVPFKSLVLFTAGRSGMENIDKLIRLWGQELFDYVIMHYDDSSSEWNRYDWYKYVVGVTAQQQAKFWFYKRFAVPWQVKGYRYVHFVDSDAGSPPDAPFDLALYDSLLYHNGVLLGQPAVTHNGRSSDHPVCRRVPGSSMRWTTFIENGPLFSVAQSAYECVWEMISAEMVSGWGVDMYWCQYLSEVCGYSKTNACAVIDEHYIEHLNTMTASGQKFGGKDYEHYGLKDKARYNDEMSRVTGQNISNRFWMY